MAVCIHAVVAMNHVRNLPVAGNWSTETGYREERYGRNDDEKSRYDDRDDEAAIGWLGPTAVAGGIRELLFSRFHPWQAAVLPVSKV